MAEEFTFQASELSQPSGSFEPAEFSFSAKELAPAPKAQNTEMEHFRVAQKALAQSPQWKSGDATQKKRLMANLQDTVFGGGYSQAQQKSEYKPESFAKGLGRKAIRYTGATLGGVAGGLAAAPTVIGVGPGATAGAMAGYGVGKATEEALLGQEPTPPPKERAFKGGTLRQGLAEAIYNVPESVGNLAEGAIAFPSALGKAAMTKGGGKQVIEDTAHMFGAPLGLYGADAAKDAWVLDPAGAALAPTMIAGGLRGLKGKGMAEPKLDQYIAKKYPNAVGMTSAEMRRSPDIKKHLADAQGAIKTITALKDEGAIKVGEQGAEQVRLPKNRMEFSDAISQAKDHVFNIYNTLKQKAGEQGVTIDSTGLQSQLKAIGEDAGLRVMRPEIIKTATELADRFAQEGPLTPDAATSIIKSANDSYKAFLRNPSAETGGKAVLDAMVANNLRKAMETSIDSEVGPGWQAYRNKYKQLSTIEKEVTKGAVVDARKSPIGLLDFTDMFSAGEAVSGIISMNPAQFAKGGTMFMIKRIYKKLKDPNAGVEKMFKMTDRQYKRPSPMSTEPWIPGAPDYKPIPTVEGEYIPPGSAPQRQAQTIDGQIAAKGEIGYTPNFVESPLKQLPESSTMIAGEKGGVFDPSKKQTPGMSPEAIKAAAKKIGVPIAAVTAYLVADEDTKKQMRMTMPMLGMIAYHSGANIPTKELNAGTLFHPDKQIVSEFGKQAVAYGKDNKLHSIDYQPKRIAPESAVRDIATKIDSTTKDQPIGMLFESDLQGQGFISSLINKLKEQGYDSAEIYDGMSSNPSLLILDKSLLNPLQLKPAVIRKGEVLTAPLGKTHYDVKEVAKGIDTSGTEKIVGFVTPDGKFLDRKQSLEWLKENDPEAYRKLDKTTREKGLESMAYAHAKGASKSIDAEANAFMKRQFGSK